MICRAASICCAFQTSGAVRESAGKPSVAIPSETAYRLLRGCSLAKASLGSTTPKELPIVVNLRAYHNRSLFLC